MSGELLRLRKEALHWRPIEGEVVAVDLRSSVYLGINRTGAILWPDLASGVTRESLTKRLAEAYDIDQAKAQSDVDEFIGTLRSLDLLEA
jgi:hypothetical protein